MNRVIRYLLVIIFLNGSTELHQVMQLPFLLSHYREHKGENPGLSLFDFFRIHYLDGQHPNDNDDEQDQQLPFKTPGTLQHTDIPQWQAPQLSIGLPPAAPALHVAIYTDGLLPARPFTVFHPPRSSRGIRI